MILKLILDIIMFIGQLIIGLVASMLPTGDLSGAIETSLDVIMLATSQALNFCYFIFGDTMFVVLPIATAVLLAKHVAIPLVVIFRSFFIKGNE